MNRHAVSKISTLASFLMLVLLPSALYAAEYATFESFYRQSWTIGWMVAALAAVIAAAGVFFFAAPVGSAAAAIGSWIGSMFGYSGVAATNFGLALLGGGSIASGGFGIAGGAALLEAVLSFSTGIIFDSATNIVETYQYAQFVQNSRQMTTLPLPRNDDGPPEYENAMTTLKAIVPNEPIWSYGNRNIVRKAINALETIEGQQEDLAPEAISRIESLRALLHFVDNDYRRSKAYAQTAIEAAKEAEKRFTLPAFLFATSSLYDDVIDFAAVLDRFQYSIREEADNPMAPLLFSVFLDRMTYRINDGTLSVEDLQCASQVAEQVAPEEEWALVKVVILSRYLILLKVQQQRISSLVASSNTAIRESTRTLSVVKRSMRDYELLLEGAQFDAGALSRPAAIDSEEAKREFSKLRDALTGYSNDRVRLEELVAALEKQQSGPSVRQPPRDREPMIGWLTLLIVVAIGIAYRVGRRSPLKQ